MRIISQGGHADLPYEEIALCINCDDIIATHNNKEHLIARYSTVEKAKKAMEMLHITYKGNKVEEVYQEGTNYYHPTFQFPADEDVKV